MKTSKISKLEMKKIQKEFKGIDKLFAELEKDKSLPTFVEFFAWCMLLENTECINLKRMYPRLYNRLSMLLAKNFNFGIAKKNVAP